MNKKKTEKVEFESHQSFVECRARWCVCVMPRTNRFAEEMKKLLVVEGVQNRIRVRTLHLTLCFSETFLKWHHQWLHQGLVKRRYRSFFFTWQAWNIKQVDMYFSSWFETQKKDNGICFSKSWMTKCFSWQVFFYFFKMDQNRFLSVYLSSQQTSLNAFQTRLKIRGQKKCTFKKRTKIVFSSDGISIIRFFENIRISENKML